MAVLHVMSDSPEYSSWNHMIYRCYNTNYMYYYDYGGRGIQVCDSWRESFEEFYVDMGPKPGPDYSLDRIDNNGHYEPDNCKWSTPKEQSNNRRIRNQNRCKYGHEFTPENTYVKPGNNKRGCRTCRAKYRAAYRAAYGK